MKVSILVHVGDKAQPQNATAHCISDLHCQWLAYFEGSTEVSKDFTETDDGLVARLPVGCKFNALFVLRAHLPRDAEEIVHH